jgi:glutathione S-transferase
MRLYFSPGACSMVVRMVLNHVGEPFEAVPVDLSVGEQRSPGFRAINPKGKVPTLVRDDGSVLTELGTILAWVAARHPEHRLLPTDNEARTRIQEAVEYCMSTIHALGTTRIFVPSAFGKAEDQEAIKAEGRRIVGEGLRVLDGRMAGNVYLADELSIADFVIYWLALGAVMSGLSLPPRIHRDYTAMQQLEAVRRSLTDEGFA